MLRDVFQTVLIGVVGQLHNCVEQLIKLGAAGADGGAVESVAGGLLTAASQVHDDLVHVASPVV